MPHKMAMGDDDPTLSDPAKLGPAFDSCVDLIVKGKTPCCYKDALEFGAIKMQVYHNDHNSKLHKPGFLEDLNEFLPKEYTRTKGAEKKMYSEHKKLAGSQNDDLKRRFVSKCRTLPTYGGEYFVVREKLKKKAKLVPRLMGVTAEKVILMDIETKAVLKTYSMLDIRRWAASPNSLTLDFGDSGIFSVQTEDGGSISSHIAGLVDSRKKKEQVITAYSSIGEAGEALATAGTDCSAMIKAVKALALTTKVLIGHLQSRAGIVNDDGEKQKYSDAATQWTETTSQMVQAAKKVGGPSSEKKDQNHLRQVAIDLIKMVNSARGSLLQLE